MEEIENVKTDLAETKARLVIVEDFIAKLSHGGAPVEEVKE